MPDAARIITEGTVMPSNELSQIITHAKKLRAKNQALEIGNDRRDKDLAELREALAKERDRVHWLEFVSGLFVASCVAVLILATVFSGPAHHG